MNLVHIDLLSLRLLIHAAEEGTLTQAAARSNMTVSAASKRLAELERNTDCSLFIRQPRGLELTAAGQGMVEHARTIMEGVHRMACDASDYAMGVRGHVRLFANTSSVIQFLPNDLAAYLEANPNVRIGLEEGLSDAIIHSLENGRADIGIFADNVAAQGMVKRVYRRDQLVVLVPADHPLADVKEVSFIETLEYDYVALNQGSSLLRRINEAAIRSGKMLRVRIQLASFDGICRMIEAGLGIGILPLASVRQESLNTSLRAVPLTDEWAARTLYVGVAEEASLSPEAKKLYEYLSGLENPEAPSDI